MKKILDKITEELKAAFAQAGYPEDKVRASISNRPDLCEYQCNGAMALAKEQHKNPIEIAEKVAEILKQNTCFSKAEAVKPGFINLTLAPEAVAAYLKDTVRFYDIPKVISTVMERTAFVKAPSLEDIFDTHKEATSLAQQLISAL